MPLPATRLIHPRFQTHHRPVAARQATAVCRIERPSSRPTLWDDTAGRHVYPPPRLLYEGPCRYQYQAAAGQPVVADQPVPLADVRITVEVSATFQVNDLVTLIEADGNPDLLGRTLTVTGVSGSSISWQRDLSCQLRQPTTR